MGGVEVRKEMDIEVAVDVEIEVEIEVAIEPIRVDTKLDIVETEAELGTKSRIHNLANCTVFQSKFSSAYGNAFSFRLLQLPTFEQSRKASPEG